MSVGAYVDHPFPPQIFDPTRYPGQMGVPGAEVDEGLRTATRSLVYYVDRSHPRALDANDGTDPKEPKATIQSAITASNATINWADAYGGTKPHNTILVGPGIYAESLTPGYYCRIIGLGVLGTDSATEIHPAAGSALSGTGLSFVLKNLWFETETAVPVIDFGVSNNVLIEDCAIMMGIAGLATMGIQTDNVSHTQIRRTLFGSGVANLPIGMQFLGGANRFFHQSLVEDCRVFAATTGIDIPANCTASGSVIKSNVIAGRPVTGIQDLNGGTYCIDNWVTASVDAISHANLATNCIANHVLDAAVGAVEATGTD